MDGEAATRKALISPWAGVTYTIVFDDAEDGLKVTYILCCQRGQEEVVVNVKRDFGKRLNELIGREARP